MGKIKNPILRALVHLALIGCCIFCITPLLWALLNSIKLPVEANEIVPSIVGFTPTMSNYEKLWLYMKGSDFVPIAISYLIVMAIIVILYRVNRKKEYLTSAKSGLIVITILVILLLILPQIAHMSKFYKYLINSVIITIATLAISISIGCLGGYALARYSGILSMVILISALAFRSLPRMAFGLPFYFFAQKSGLYDTHIFITIVLVALNQPFTIWMLRSFFKELPIELEQAAMIDGANRLQSFLKIIIPIAWPGIITTSLFTLLLAYNEFLMAKLLMQSNWTLPVAIISYTSGEDAAYRTIAAAASVSITLPLIIVITFFQKHLVRGMASGAVKG
jgi:ABC-type glycerol-3-phosphate transport system permease component